MNEVESIRAVQYFSDEHLEYCKQLTPKQILQFIDQFQRLHFAREQHAKSHPTNSLAASNNNA